MKRILVIGESAYDVFIYCDAKRLAPDLPIPVLNIVSQTENPAMAGNLERNIKSLMSRCDIVTNKDWKKMKKTRYVHKDSNHTFFRVDTHNSVKRVKIDKISLKEYDLVAISDYNKGFLTEEDIKYICDNHPNVFIDTKKVLGDFVKNAKFIKINNPEYERSKDNISIEIKNKIIVTKGESGAVFQGENYPVNKVDVKDVSGAGDSFFGALIVRYFETSDIKKSIKFANKLASEVVKSRGVSVIKRD